MTERLSGPSMLGLLGDYSGPSLWRVLQPFTALEKAGYPCGWDSMRAPGIGAIATRYEAVLIPRLSWQPGQRRLAERWFASLRAAGRLVVYDCDDDLFTPAIDRRMVELGWTDGKTAEQLEAARYERIWAMQQSDGVTVSTQRLATIVRSFTSRPVVVVPNAIDVRWFRRVLRRARRQDAGPTIGWAGGQRPDEDVEQMAEGWRRVAERHPEVRFVVQGYLPPVVKAAVPEDRLVGIPWLPLDRYPEGLVEVDVACCAVADRLFNRAKSVIKALEAAVAGSAVVATPTLYGSLVENNVTGLLAETADEWAASLNELIEHPARRAILARRLLRVVEKHHTLAGNLWRWPAAWAEIAAAAGEHRQRIVSA